MATLNSPGVSVTVIDESFYTPAAPGTVPMLFVASAQDKTTPSGSTAQGTTAANAGKVWLITSQRDLTDTFGTPLFYTDASGNAQHGNELNEYGLQAAYSLLGVSSRAYVVRADLDLSQLVPSSDAPEGDPVSGTYWVDTDASIFGIKEWNSSTQKFTVKTPIVLDDDSPANYFNGNVPADGVGQRGDYCMIVTKNNDNQLFHKTSGGTWEDVESGFNGNKNLQISPHYTYPTTFNASTASGSVWITTTSPSNGANWSVKYYNGSTKEWSTVSAPIYSSLNAANYALDPVGGGKNIPVGSLCIESNWTQDATTPDARFKLWRRNATGPTTITSNASTSVLGVATTASFVIRETNTAGNWVNTATVSITGDGSKIGSLIPGALNVYGLNFVS